MSIRSAPSPLRAVDSERSSVDKMAVSDEKRKRKARQEEAARLRALRNRRIEAFALGVLALLPIVPYLTFVLRAGVPRYALIGDHALLEQAARHVFHGDTLLGPHSRFHWNQPGPLFFYLIAPFQVLFGSSSTGLYVGTIVLNGASAGAIATCARLFARRAHAIAALLVVLAWFVAFGNTCANPWSPLVVVLPLMAFLVNAALLARGKSAALYPLVIFGTLATQTHVAVVSTTVVTSIVALAVFLVGARRRGGLEKFEQWRLAIAAAMIFVFFVPPLVEQVMAPAGNLKKLYRFFVHREAPLKPLSVATIQWTRATTWLPERMVGRTILSEGATPAVIRGDAMANIVSANERLVAIVHVMAVAIAAIIAARRRDVVSLSLLGMGAIADAIAVTALQAVVGPSYLFLVFWTTGASSVAWIGVLATAFSILGGAFLKLPRLSGVVAPALVIIGLSAAVTSTSLQRFWLAKNPTVPATRADLRTDLRALDDAIRAKTTKDGTIVVVHRDVGAKEICDAVVLELEKSGADVRVSNADRDTYAGIRTANGVAKPLHLWFTTSEKPLPKAQACTPLVVKSGDLSAYGGEKEIVVCPPP